MENKDPSKIATEDEEKKKEEEETTVKFTEVFQEIGSNFGNQSRSKLSI